MSFRFGTFYALILAGGLPAGCLLAQTNSVEKEQPIIFSSPDGETVSNALIPAAESPAPSFLANLPQDVPDSISYPQIPMRRLSHPPRISLKRNRSDSLLDKEETGLATPSEIMGVPTLRDIFGLPKPYATYDQKTGDLDLDKTLDKAMDLHPASDFLSGSPNDSPVAPHESSPAYSVFSSSPFGQTPIEQATFSPQPELSKVPMLAATPAFSQSASAANSAFSHGLNAPLPFAVPGSTLPQLPSTPVFQNNSTVGPISPPSWAPKPAPWLSQMPALGTMEQRKF
jgi:hypothetical protein